MANDELTTYKALALARIVCPQTNIPATTALVSLNGAEGYRLGLQRGANVIMPNLTPMRYRKMYEIYPAKACVRQAPEAFHENLVRTFHAIGRTVGRGPGCSPQRLKRLSMPQESRKVA